jgi:hypothetical protein
MITLELHLTPSYAALAERSGGLTATLTATFKAAGHAVLRERFEVTFLRRPTGRARRKRRSTHG